MLFLVQENDTIYRLGWDGGTFRKGLFYAHQGHIVLLGLHV